MSIFRDNPVLQREVRGRFNFRRIRTQKATLVTVGAITLVIVYFYGRALLGIIHGQSEDARGLWTVIIYGLLFFVVLLSPALSSTAISQEREQKTWEALTTSRLTASEVLLGKWLARQLPVILLIVIALPLLITCTFVGGLGTLITIAALVFLFLTTGLYSMLGLLCSYFARRTTVATTGALLLSAFLCLGTLIIDGIYSTFTMHYSHGPLMWINPFYALSSLVYTLKPNEGNLAVMSFASSNQAWTGIVIYYLLLFMTIIFCFSLMIVRYRRAAQER